MAIQQGWSLSEQRNTWKNLTPALHMYLIGSKDGSGPPMRWPARATFPPH
jgi:hypothetical protein